MILEFSFPLFFEFILVFSTFFIVKRMTNNFLSDNYALLMYYLCVVISGIRVRDTLRNETSFKNIYQLKVLHTKSQRLLYRLFMVTLLRHLWNEDVIMHLMLTNGRKDCKLIFAVANFWKIGAGELEIYMVSQDVIHFKYYQLYSLL